MLNWLCPCTPTEESTVLQEYPSADINIFPPRGRPINEEHISMGRATKQQTKQKMQEEISLLRPRKEQEIVKDSRGYLSIASLRQASSASNAVFRKIKKSRYQQIRNECKKRQTKWTDPDFNNQVKFPIAQWKRITEISNAQFMKGEVKPTAVIQGRFNNCYWISAIAVLAEREYRIKSLFGSLQTDPWGVYMCRLLFDGVYQEVVVDDYFPVDKNGKLVTAKIPANGDFWPLVIEKCWAKLHKSYANTEMGYNMAALWGITASPVRGQYDTAYIRISQARTDNFYTLLKHHQSKNHIITCSVDRASLAKEVDLQSMHSYSVLGIFQTENKKQKVKLLQIRNPIGNYNRAIFPGLKYNYQDSFWKNITPDEKDRLEYWRMQKATIGFFQGIFYVEWQDFLTHFNQVAIAQLNDNANYIYDTLPFYHFRPHFFSLNVASIGDEPLHLIVAQQTPLLTIKRTTIWPYGVVRVIVCSITYDSNNQPIYQFILGKSLMEKEQTNYLDVDLSELLPGNYIIRISLLFDAASNQNKQKPVNVGYYGSGVFAVKHEEGVDDCDFLGRTMLSRAKQMVNKDSSLKQPLRWAEGWSYIETIPDANYGYIWYHVEAGSEYERYSIILDESDNEAGFFMEGHWVGHNTLNQVIKRGQEIVIPYSFGRFMPSIDRFPQLIDTRKKPVVTFQPVFQ